MTFVVLYRKPVSVIQCLHIPTGKLTSEIKNTFVYFDHCHSLLLLHDKRKIARNPITFPARSNLSDFSYFFSIYIFLVCKSVSQHLATPLKSMQQETLLLQLFGHASMLSGLSGTLQMPQPVDKMVYIRIYFLYRIIYE